MSLVENFIELDEIINFEKYQRERWAEDYELMINDRYQRLEDFGYGVGWRVGPIIPFETLWGNCGGYIP